MGFSSWAGRRRSCMTFIGPSMTEKTVVEARARKISGSSRLRWVVGAERCLFLSYVCTRVCARRWALTEPERLHCRLRVTEPERSIDPLLLTEPVVELSRQMSLSKDLVVEPSPLGILKGLNGTKDTKIILVRPLTLKVKAYFQLRWYCLGFR